MCRFFFPHRDADTSWVIFLIGLFAVMLGAAGSGLVGLGAVMTARGDVGAGLLGVAVGLFVLYGAYLFARAAWRTRRALLSESPAERRNTRRQALVSVASLLAVAAGNAVMPAPTPLRVIGAICAILLLPLVLAREFEPRKKKRSTPHT